MSEDVIELLIYHQPSVKPSLTLRPFGVLDYVAGHSLTEVSWQELVTEIFDFKKRRPPHGVSSTCFPISD